MADALPHPDTAAMLAAAFAETDPVKQLSIVAVMFQDCLDNAGLTVEQGCELLRRASNKRKTN